MLNIDNLQFRLMHHFSCANALFVLSQVVDYFISHGSSVYLASLDDSKAFDRANHVKLFDKLVDRGLPDWYGKKSLLVLNGITVFLRVCLLKVAYAKVELYHQCYLTHI